MMSDKRTYGIWIAWFALVAAVVAQLSVVVGSIAELVTYATVDDTYLYLTIARNWSVYGMPTFDGETLTNGFQLVWQLVLVALANLTIDEDLLLRMACLLCVALNGLTGLVLLRIGTALDAKAVGQIAAISWAIYMFRPESILGMEAPLHGLVFAFVVYRFVALDRQGVAKWKYSELVALGALLTLLAYCRLDSGLIAAWIAVWVGWPLVRSKRWAPLLAFFTLPIVGCVLYFGWNQLYFGSATPVSGAAKMFWAHDASPQAWHTQLSVALGAVVHVMIATWMRMTGYTPIILDDVLQGHMDVIVQVVKYIGLLVVALYGVVMAVRTQRCPRALGWLFAAIPIHIFVNGFLLQQFATSSWYYQPARLMAALLIGHITFVFVQRERSSMAYKIGYGILGIAFLQAAYGGITYAQTRGNDTYVNRMEAAQWLAASLPVQEDARVGSWNAGQIGYFCSQHHIVSLDGLVQSPLFLDNVLRTGNYRAYLREKKIHYLVDYNGEDATQTYRQIWNRGTVFRGLVPLEEAEVIASFGGVLVLDIRPWLAKGD